MYRFRVYLKVDPETTLAEGVVWSDGSCDVRPPARRQLNPGRPSAHHESMRDFRRGMRETHDIEFIDPPDEDWAEPATEGA